MRSLVVATVLFMSVPGVYLAQTDSSEGTVEMWSSTESR